MITHTFDADSAPIISPEQCYGRREKLCDVCIITFSKDALEAALNAFPCRQAAEFESATGNRPIYLLTCEGREIAFYLTLVGSSSAGTCIEEARCLIGAEHYIMFGSCGCLDQTIPLGTAIIPTEAYRDEGFSYHYAPPSDYIKVKNAQRVVDFFQAKNLPFILGKTWTTDAMFRETQANMARRKAEGCIAVEMECAGAQAVCDYLGVEYYDFFLNGDLLDSEVWDGRIMGSDTERKAHLSCFDLALELALSLSGGPLC